MGWNTVWFIRRIACAVSLLSVVAGWGARTVMAAGADDPQTPIVCAVLSSRDGTSRPLAELLTAELAGRPQLTLVERAAVEQVLREQGLGEAFAAGQTGRRAELGRLLRADLLVLLRPADAGKPGPAARGPDTGAAVPPADGDGGGAGADPGENPRDPADVGVRLVVCETRRGLRLLDAVVSPTPDAEADARAAAAMVVEAAAKLRGTARQVVAVLPFDNRDLTHELDHLKGAYAKLVEQTLVGHDGVLAVELDEARSLGEEVALTDGPGVARDLPLYVFGRFRSNRVTAPASPLAITLELSLRRGERELTAARKEGVPAAEAPAVLAAMVSGWVDTLGKPAAAIEPNDPGFEARQLATRARAALVRRDWSEAVSLGEASLLLDPSQDKVRLHTALAMAMTAPMLEERERLGAALYGKTASPDERARDATAIEAHILAVRRRYDHLEAYLRRVTDPSADGPVQVGGAWRFWNADHIGGRYGRQPALAAYNDRIDRIPRETFLRVVRARTAADVPGDRVIEEVLYAMPWRLRHETQEDGLRLMVSVFNELARSPGAPKFAAALVLTSRDGLGVRWVGRNSPERHAYLKARQAILLHALRASADPRVAAAVDEAEQRIADMKARDRAPYREAASFTPEDKRRQPVRFRPVEITSTDGVDGHPVQRYPFPIDGWRPIGDGLDLLWDSLGVYLMRRPGHLEVAFDLPWPAPNLTSVSFDGRYVWAAYMSHPNHPEPKLLVRDPRPGGRTWRITAADGLPIGLNVPGGGDAPFGGHDLYVCGVAPGRACVVGHFGRTWLAMVSLEPDQGPTAKVFHETREREPGSHQSGKEDEWLDTTLPFKPRSLFLLRGPAAPEADGAVERRVLITGRGDRPLLVDPDRLMVRAIATRHPDAFMEKIYCEHDGAVYVIRTPFYDPDTERGPHVYRIGFPSFEWEPVMKNVPKGYVRFAGDRALVFGKQLWELELDARRAWPQTTKVPWLFRNHIILAGDEGSFAEEMRTKPGPGMIGFGDAFESSHYGLVVYGGRSSDGTNEKILAVELPGTGASVAAPGR